MEQASQSQCAGLTQAPKARKIFLILEPPICNEVLTKEVKSELIPVNGVEAYYQIRPQLIGQVCTTPLFTPDNPLLPAKKQSEHGNVREKKKTQTNLNQLFSKNKQTSSVTLSSFPTCPKRTLRGQGLLKKNYDCLRN